MRTLLRSLAPSLRLGAGLLVATATPALAQEHAEEFSLMSPRAGLMIWTLLIFAALFFILKRFVFPSILTAVEERERALQGAIEGAKRDREEAARLLAEHRQQLEGARAETQRLIAEGRATGEKVRQDMLDQARREQQEIIARARRDIQAERDRAIAELRREAVDLAIAGASRVIEQNLDSQANRKLVESFLAGVGPVKPGRA